MVLTRDDVADRHTYLAEAFDSGEWRASMGSIRRKGGPWSCPNVDTHASLLCYRCSICGAEINDG